ncbi:MAG: hypothetical protein ACPKOI_02800 [Pleomorphochaeta sp.]
MDYIQFRTITPIFNFSFDDENLIYKKKGIYHGVKYSIELKKYGKKEYNKILGGLADDYSYKNLTSIHMEEGYGATDYFMTCDLFYENTNIVKESLNTLETNTISSALVTSLNIVSSYGINYKTTYILRKPYISAHYSNTNKKIGATMYENCVTHGPLSSPFPLNILALKKSVLNKEDFDLFDKIIDFYLEDIPETQFTRIFKLANNYFRLAFTVEKKEHAYLFLILVFETLLRDTNCDKSSNVSSKISKLIASITESNFIGSVKNNINNKFYKNKNSFYNIRNEIAHGNPIFYENLLKKKLLELFKYTRLLLILSITEIYPNIDQMNYFEDIKKIIDKKYQDKVLQK